MIDLGIVKPGSTHRIPWGSYAAATGASAAASNYADADILVYKDGSTTEVAGGSCGGTATTSFDSGSLTGINLATLNLADNTTAGHWAAGSEYLVMVGPVTVDSQTVYLPLCRFRIGLPGAVLNTTIATLASQTSFTLTAGPAEDDALNGCVVYIHDVASAVQGGFAVILDYVGSTKTVTLAAATTFTVAATDNISVMGPMPLQPTVFGRTLDVSSGGEAGVDWANVGTPGSTVSLSATTVATTTTVTNQVTANMTAISGDSTAADNLETTFDDTAGAVPWVGIIDQGTAQSAAAGTLTIRAAAAFGDNTLAGGVAMAFGSTQGYWQAVGIASNVGSTDVLTLSSNWAVTPSGTITYKLFACPPPATTGTLPAVNVTQVDGSALATHATGYFPDDLRQIAGAAVSTSTAQLGVNVVNAAGTAWNSGAISASTLATDTITAAKIAADAGTEIGTAVWATTTRVLTAIDEDTTTLDLDATIRSAVGLASANLDAQLDDLPTNAELASSLEAADDDVLAAVAAIDVAAIADAVWDELLSGHAVSGSTGEALSAAGSAGDPWITSLPGAYSSGQAGYIVGTNLNATVSSRATQTSVDAIDDLVDTEVAAIKTVVDAILVDTAEIGAAGAGLTAIPWNATWDAEVQSEATDALNAYDPPTRAELTTDTNSVLTAIGDVPTNAELATALGTADDAVLAAIAALNNLSAAQVNAEVVDALSTDTYAEPGQGAPAATTTLAAKINYLYKAWRNRKTQTSSQFSLYADDATTVDQKAAVADDGTTTSVAEIAGGP